MRNNQLTLLGALMTLGFVINTTGMIVRFELCQLGAFAPVGQNDGAHHDVKNRRDADRRKDHRYVLHASQSTAACPALATRA